MKAVELPQGTIEYADTGGAGPALVLLHGLLMDGEIWREVVDELAPRYRCILPTLPLGAHRQPMDADADLSLRGLGRLVADFLEETGLEDVTLCFNDWCGAQTMIADGLVGRVGRVALVSCEAYENYPPGIPGRVASISAKLPGGISMMRQSLRRRRLRNLPFVFGVMSRRGVSNAMMDAWLEPLARREIQHDLRKYLGGAREGRRQILAATPAMRRFERPVLVAWGAEDKLMPLEHGRRLAEDFPNATLEEVPAARTLVPWDNPGALSQLLAAFAPDHAAQGMPA